MFPFRNGKVVNVEAPGVLVDPVQPQVAPVRQALPMLLLARLFLRNSPHTIERPHHAREIKSVGGFL